MTKETMNELVRLAKDGNQTAISKLYLQCEGMIRNYCRKYRNLNCLELEDLVQYCTVYFMMAIEKFDLSRDLKFTTFLHGQLQQVYRDVLYSDFVVRRSATHIAELKENPDAGYKSLALDAKMDGDGNLFHEVYADGTANAEESMIEAEASNAINLAFKTELDTYNALDRTIIELLIYANYGNKRVREELDLKTGKVERLIKEFRVVMRDKLAKVQSDNLYYK
jgi:RNA polymerase sigma factor (sigma-70 family)